MSLDLDHLRQWIGRSETRVETLAPFPANALAATLDRADPPYEAGTALPPLWHWLHFLPVSPLAEAGPDGHPARGGFLPPVPLPRRMWAGSRLSFPAPLLIGETATRVSTVTRIEHKAGKTGDLVFVTVRHEIAGASGPAIAEEHDIVYRSLPPPDAPPARPLPAPDGAEWSIPVRPDPVLLFRYSALTFNSHRIHYDLDYVTREEGYPGLVVHGPLIATLLLDGLRRKFPDHSVNEFSFRALAPTFHIDTFAVHGRRLGPGHAQLWAEKSGQLTMEAEVRYSTPTMPARSPTRT
ncbi:MAG: MaoC family dehydratase N-terminal domain-containing protein [Beijerinckiaceae bacterium]|nr:MaoC family dehydratase N-terminal domain-containing protein [Beijerinckiaceae bacterium]